MIEKLYKINFKNTFLFVETFLDFSNYLVLLYLFFRYVALLMTLSFPLT